MLWMAEAFDILGQNRKHIKCKGYLDKWEIDKYIECDTFRAFDREIIIKLTGNLLEGIGEFDKYHEIIDKRRTGHWFGIYRNEYEALYFAAEVFKMEKE